MPLAVQRLANPPMSNRPTQRQSARTAEAIGSSFVQIGDLMFWSNSTSPPSRNSLTNSMFCHGAIKDPSKQTFIFPDVVNNWLTQMKGPILTGDPRTETLELAADQGNLSRLWQVHCS